MRTVCIEVIIAVLIFISATCEAHENKTGIQLAATIPGGCNDKGMLRNDDGLDKEDTVIVSTIADTVNIFVGYNYICSAPFKTECEIKNDSILIYVIDTCENPSSCYARCYCYYTFDFKFVGQGEHYPYKILLSDPRENAPKAISEGNLPVNSPTGIKSNILVSDEELLQNTPNPFSQSTVIRYSLPQAYSSARLVISNTAGSVVRQIPLQSGTDSITIEGGALPAGSYFYSLYVDGTLVDTKQMILTK